MARNLPDLSLIADLSAQLRLLDGWRLELLMEPDPDISKLERLDLHRDWLQRRISDLERSSAQMYVWRRHAG